MHIACSYRAFISSYVTDPDQFPGGCNLHVMEVIKEWREKFLNQKFCQPDSEEVTAIMRGHGLVEMEGTRGNSAHYPGKWGFSTDLFLPSPPLSVSLLRSPSAPHILSRIPFGILDNVEFKLRWDDSTSLLPTGHLFLSECRIFMGTWSWGYSGISCSWTWLQISHCYIGNLVQRGRKATLAGADCCLTTRQTQRRGPFPFSEAVNEEGRKKLTKEGPIHGRDFHQGSQTT